MKELRSINNLKLLDSKNVLRRDVKEKEDYFIVNDKVWKFVQLMYGGGPEIVKDKLFPVIPFTNKKQEIKMVGVVNPLNLCFMISVIQCLLSCQQIAFYFYKRLFDDSKRKLAYHNALHKIVRAMIESKNNRPV